MAMRIKKICIKSSLLIPKILLTSDFIFSLYLLYNPRFGIFIVAPFLGVLERSLIQNILGGELDDKFNRLPNPG